MVRELESVEQMREMGKALYFEKDADPENRREGLRLLAQAGRAGDPEANYLLGQLTLAGAISVTGRDRQSHGLQLLQESARRGYPQARSYLNRYCQARDAGRRVPKRLVTGPLVDFEGKRIKIDRKGVFTPVDAVLTYENGENILTLQTNVQFVYSEAITDPEEFEAAVCRGIQAWSGEYTVFGGQKVTVRVELTREDHILDNLVVIPVTAGLTNAIQTVGNIIPNAEKRTQMTEMATSKRSFATMGRKWTANSRKLIFIQSQDGSFNDYPEIYHVTKHEFGHALGLGDLYASSVDALPGVESGTYEELDCYCISDRFYNLVMCDHHGTISNNDIEMVILAFRENKMQHYQVSRIKGKISAALGKGN